MRNRDGNTRTSARRRKNDKENAHPQPHIRPNVHANRFVAERRNIRYLQINKIVLESLYFLSLFLSLSALSFAIASPFSEFLCYPSHLYVLFDLVFPVFLFCVLAVHELFLHFSFFSSIPWLGQFYLSV